MAVTSVVDGQPLLPATTRGSFTNGPACQSWTRGGARQNNHGKRTTVRYLKTQVPLWIALRTASTAALATADNSTTHDLTHTGIGHSALAVFLLAHLVVMAEEFTHLRKSKPAILAAGVIDA